MRALIICASVSHGNTSRIAAAIAEVLEAEVVKPQEINVAKLAEYDLIGFGSGIFFGRHHGELFRLVGALPTLNKRAFVFSTRGAGPPWVYHQDLRDELRAKGLHIIGEFSAKGWDTYGPLKYIGGINRGRPDEKDLNRAGEFARSLLKP